MGSVVMGEQLKPADDSSRHTERWAVMISSDGEVGMRVRKKDLEIALDNLSRTSAYLSLCSPRSNTVAPAASGVCKCHQMSKPKPPSADASLVAPPTQS